MTRRLPNLLYAGDIPVEASYQSSIQLHRLLGAYPRESLCILETREPPSQPARRLPGVRYHALPVANRARLRGSLSGPYRLWLTATVAQRAADALQIVDGFQPDAILTIGSGFGWLVAAAIAQRLAIPLHFIAHDDWPKPSSLDAAFRGWLQARYGHVYREAQSRLCVSPFMIEEFERRYGVRGDLLYPVRAADDQARAGAAIRALSADEPIVIAFGGGSGSHVMPGLRTLAQALSGVAARVMLFGPFDKAKQQELRSLFAGFEFRGLVSPAEMIDGARHVDLLFAPMAFDAASRDNMTVSFPSKLADYTAAGVPILIHAPPYSSAARWAERHHDAAAVVTVDDRSTLRDKIAALKCDRAARQALAAGAIRAGDACFSLGAGRALFEGALQ